MSDNQLSKSVPALMLFLFLSSGLPPSASAQSQTVTAKDMIGYADKNGDGKIGKDEASEQLKSSFDYVDTNKDGFVNLKEAEVMAKFVNEKNAKEQKASEKSATTEAYTAEQIIGFMDLNNDGKISKDESSSELKPNFGYIDTNKDGFIDLKEAKVMAAYAKQSGKSNFSKSGTAPMNESNAAEAKKLISKLDKDGDGKISKKESLRNEDLRIYFGDIDTNNDDQIDGMELLAAIEPAEQDLPQETMDGKTTPQQVMEENDKNGDGKISKDEGPEELKASFEYVDTNKDGFIDLTEAKIIADYINN